MTDGARGGSAAAIGHAIELGATLYVPATRGDLAAVLLGGRIAGLRSAVLCLEDAVRACELPQALDNAAALLRVLPARGGPALFVRPRDAAMLARVARLPGAERLAGFVLPKVTAASLPAFVAASPGGQLLMPTIETREAFDANEMHRLRAALLAIRARVPAIRIGGNDLLATIGTRRSRLRTLYDGPLGPLVAQLVATFVPWGFALTAPVMERYDAPRLLREEVARDLEHGLTGKTAIHPAQVAVIHAALAVGSDELADARAMLAADAPAVWGSGGRMAEPATHSRWAEATLRRAALFGVADALPLAYEA